MKPYAELLYYNQVNPNTRGNRRIRDKFKLLEPEDIIEFGGRNDYGPTSTAKLGQLSLWKGSMVSMIQKWLGMGHTSMIELGDATFYLECSRTVLTEITRHRLASFQVESQRFVKYDDVDPDKDFYYPDSIENVDGIWFLEDPGEFIEPVTVPGSVINPGVPAYDALLNHYAMSVELYQQLRAKGVPPQDARYVLPNGFMTRIVMKADVREWAHIIKLRLDKSAQPEMQELIQQVYDQLVEIYPNALYGVLDRGRGER